MEGSVPGDSGTDCSYPTTAIVMSRKEAFQYTVPNPANWRFDPRKERWFDCSFAECTRRTFYASAVPRWGQGILENNYRPSKADNGKNLHNAVVVPTLVELEHPEEQSILRCLDAVVHLNRRNLDERNWDLYGIETVGLGVCWYHSILDRSFEYGEVDFS